LTVPVKDWPREARFVRSWDFAATDPKRQKTPGDPDYTVGVLLAFKDGRYWIVDLLRVRR
jgi:phage terminase large subunit-like protein